MRFFPRLCVVSGVRWDLEPRGLEMLLHCPLPALGVPCLLCPVPWCPGSCLACPSWFLSHDDNRLPSPWAGSEHAGVCRVEHGQGLSGPRTVRSSGCVLARVSLSPGLIRLPSTSGHSFRGLAWRSGGREGELLTPFPGACSAGTQRVGSAAGRGGPQ